jgi:hypothetical protein
MGAPGLLTEVRAFIEENPGIDWTDRGSTARLYERFDCVTGVEKKKMRSYKASALKTLGLKTGTPKPKVQKAAKPSPPSQRVEQLELPGLPNPALKSSGETVKYGLALDKTLLKEFRKALIDREESGADVIRRWIQQYIEQSR